MHIPMERKNKLAVKLCLIILIDYDDKPKVYWCYKSKTRKILIGREVSFNKELFKVLLPLEQKFIHDIFFKSILFASRWIVHSKKDLEKRVAYKRIQALERKIISMPSEAHIIKKFVVYSKKHEAFSCDGPCYI